MNFDQWLRLIRFIVLSLIGIGFSIVFGLKVYDSTVNQFEFNDVISLLLAFFAILLSYGFYMRSSETSEKFYDNTYNFTKDISETLGRIEERFGEKLTYLGESYTKLHDDVRSLPHSGAEEEKRVKELEKELGNKEKEFNTKEEDRKRQIEELIKRAKLSDSERAAYLNELKIKDLELEEVKKELKQIKRDLNQHSLKINSNFEYIWVNLPHSLKRYIKEYLSGTSIDLLEIDSKQLEILESTIMRRGLYIDILKHHNIFSDTKFTEEGVSFLKYLKMTRG